VKFTCPSCATSLTLRDDLVGRKILCPKCKAKVRLVADGVARIEAAKPPDPPKPAPLALADAPTPKPDRQAPVPPSPVSPRAPSDAYVPTMRAPMSPRGEPLMAGSYEPSQDTLALPPRARSPVQPAPRPEPPAPQPPSRRDGLLFGKAAVDLGFITREQYDQVIARRSEGGRSVGRVLVDRGWLTDGQVARVRAQRDETLARFKREDRLFAQAAIDRELVAREAVDECVRMQAVLDEWDEYDRLAALCVMKSYLTRDAAVSLARSVLGEMTDEQLEQFVGCAAPAPVKAAAQPVETASDEAPPEEIPDEAPLEQLPEPDPQPRQPRLRAPVAEDACPHCTWRLPAHAWTCPRCLRALAAPSR
jgi:hypothetical protein